MSAPPEGRASSAPGSAAPASAARASRREGVPLSLVIVGAVVLVGGTAGGGWLYMRALRAEIWSPQPIPVEEVESSTEALADLVAGVEEARRAGGSALLDEVAWNRLLCHELLGDPRRAVRFELAAPFVRLRIAERDGADAGGEVRYLNAVLLCQLFPAEDGLGLAVRSGVVGRVSVDSTAGEWARTRIERQLAHEWRDNPRTGPLFRGLREVRVEASGVRLVYGSGG